MLGNKLRFGAFIAPFHPLDENPTLAIQRDLELVQLMDQLGYEEAWIGEHHSAAYELIASPEVFIAAAAERTKHIRLGTGVSSLPYHHPMMLADRINQLDHMTRGRVMFGAGPGALSSDAFMMGIPVAKQRDRMDEALDVLVRLLRGEEVSHDSDWFQLVNARLQMTPYSRPSVEIAVASQVSPTGARAAGKHGIGLLSLGATTSAGFNSLAANWGIAEDIAKESGKTMDRNAWRLVGQMHIAETKDKAIERIEQLVEESGGFGCYLMMAHNWANWENTKRSYEMIARYVVPHFQQLNVNRQASMEWVRQNKTEFTAQTRAAVGARIVSHMMEKGTEQIRPEIVALIQGAATKPTE